MEIPPSLIQASIPSTFSAPTLTSRVLHSTNASTVTSIATQTVPLYVSTLLGSTIQTNTVYGSTITSNNIWIDILLASSIIGSTIQTDTSLVSSLTGSTLRTNTIYVSSATGLTVQTNICDTPIVSGSTIQSNTLITSTMIGDSIQSNTLITSTLTTSTIQSNIIKVSTLLGSTIQLNTIKVSTIVCSTIQNNQLNTNITTGSTLYANIFQPSTLQVSTLLGSTIQTNIASIGTLQLAGSTFQTNNFNFNTITGSTIQAYTVNVSTLLGSTLIGCTIQVNAIKSSTISGSTIQATQLNVSSLIGSTIQIKQGNVSTIQYNTLIGSTIQTNQLNGSTITASSIQNNIIQMSSLTGGTIQISTLSISSLIGSTIQTSTFLVSTISGSTIQINTLQVSTLSGSTIKAIQLNLSTLVCSTFQTNRLDGSTILYSSIQTNTLSASTIRSSTIIGTTFQTQTDTLQVSTLACNALIKVSYNRNTILITDANKNIITTTERNASNLQYITNLTSQAGGQGQANTWSSAQTFSTVDIYYNGLTTETPLYTLGINASNQMVKYLPNFSMNGTLTENYIPYASGVSTLSNSIIYRVNATDIAVGQTTSTFPKSQTVITGVTVYGEYFTFDLGTGGNYHNRLYNDLSGWTTLNQVHFFGSDDNVSWISLGTATSPTSDGSGNYNYTLSNKRYLRVVLLNLRILYDGGNNSTVLFNPAISQDGGTNLYTNPNQVSLSPNLIQGDWWASWGLKVTNTMYTGSYGQIGTYTGSTVTTTSQISGGPTPYTLTVAGNTQATSVITETGTLSKIVMLDKRAGINGLLIPDSNACNFYMGTINNNNSGNYTDTLYLNSAATFSAATFDMTDSFNVRNNIVVTSAGAGFETMPSFTPSTTGLTFSALFICTGSTMPSTWARVFDIGNTTGTGATRGFLIAFHNSNVIWVDYRQADGTVTSMSTSIQLKLNTLYHVVWTISSSGTHVLYINGQQAATMTKVITFDTLPYFYLGKSNWSADPYPNMTIFDFRMMNRFLSLSDVHTLYYNLKYVSVSSITQGPVFNTTSSFNITNNVVVSSAGTGFATLPSFTPSSTTLTFSVLLICTGSSMPAQYSRIFDVGNLSQAPSRNFGIRFDASNTITAYYTTSATTAFLQTSSIVLRLNTVYHIAWTISSAGTHTLYINGNQTATMTQVITLDTLPYFYLGKSLYSGDPYPNMTVYDFRMMNQTLSASEVNSLQYFLKNTYVTSVISGQYIVLNRPYSGDFNLAEIQVFSYPGGPNIITPSTSVSYANINSSYPTSNFVDGNFNTFLHNDGTLGGPITVNLGSTKPIYKIVIYNRAGCCWNRSNGMVLTIQNSSNTVIYTSSPVPDKLGRTTAMLSETGNITDYYYTYTYFPPYVAVIGDFEKITGPYNVNVVMFNKGTPGMRIYQGTNESPNNYTTYKNLLVTDANSGNITIGSGSDTDGITFGPSATTPSYLKVGSGTDRCGPNTGQIISTNGNLHLDCGSNSKSIKINASNGSSSIQMYGKIFIQGPNWLATRFQAQTVVCGGRIHRSGLRFNNIVESGSYHWMYGVNTEYAFYKSNSKMSIKLTGRYGFYTRDAGWSRVVLRIYSRASGVYRYYYFDTYTNHAWNQLTHPIDIVLQEGVIPWAGWYDVYIYCDGNSWTDWNDQLYIYATALPGSEY